MQVDELDLLVTKKQTVLYNLFDWPTHRHSRLVVIGIANTMDLPERMLPRVHSRLGLRRLDFRPYTSAQIQAIVHSRLEGVAAYDPASVQLCSHKVAGATGDVRKALEICRRAAEIASSSGSPSVTISHATEAISEIFASTRVGTLRSSCSFHEQLFVTCAIIEGKRLGTMDVPFGNIVERVRGVCVGRQIAPPHAAKLVEVTVLSYM
jgi:Cdc6-like AAA superfamily ATPase